MTRLRFTSRCPWKSQSTHARWTFRFAASRQPRSTSFTTLVPSVVTRFNSQGMPWNCALYSEQGCDKTCVSYVVLPGPGPGRWRGASERDGEGQRGRVVSACRLCPNRPSPHAHTASPARARAHVSHTGFPNSTGVALSLSFLLLCLLFCYSPFSLPLGALWRCGYEFGTPRVSRPRVQAKPR